MFMILGFITGFSVTLPLLYGLEVLKDLEKTWYEAILITIMLIIPLINILVVWNLTLDKKVSSC